MTYIEILNTKSISITLPGSFWILIEVLGNLIKVLEEHFFGEPIIIDMSNIGSIISVEPVNFKALRAIINEV